MPARILASALDPRECHHASLRVFLDVAMHLVRGLGLGLGFDFGFGPGSRSGYRLGLGSESMFQVRIRVRVGIRGWRWG